MTETAKGTISGFIFQFEKALLLLSGLKNLEETVSVEHVDDVAVLDKNIVIIVVQAKHSILPFGSTFQNTSYALWRTLQIWIQKIDQGICDKKTKFVCCSNKELSSNSLLNDFGNIDFSEVLKKIEQIINDQENKLLELRKLDKSKGNSIERILKIIKSVLRKKKQLELIVTNLEVHIEKNIKEQFLNNIHLGIDKYTNDQKDKIYHEFHGWIFVRSQAKWRNGKNAIFSKKDFDEKFFQIFNNPSITNLVFRTKKDLNSLYTIKQNLYRNLSTELFIKQIEDIERRSSSKDRILKEAIINFFYFDIELAYIIKEGNYTNPDIEEFIDQCKETWQEYFDKIVILDNDKYSDAEKNELAIKIYDETMSDVKIKFKNFIAFNSSNQYFKKGCFLKLSNIPEIGWHPEWIIKYKEND